METTTTQSPSTLFDVISGREAIKAEFGISTSSIIIACAVILTTFIVGVLVIKQIKS